MSASGGPGRIGWAIGMAIAFSLSASIAIAGVMGLTRRLEITRGPTSVGRALELRAKLHSIRKARGSDAVGRVAYVGDSTVVTYLPGRQLPNRLEARINANREGEGVIRVQSVANPGIGAFSFYYLAESIVWAEPDLVLLETSFIHYSDRWMRQNDRPELAAWLGGERFVESLGLPLMHNGLRLDRQLLYQGIVGLGQARRWQAIRQMQSRVEKLRRKLEAALAEHVGFEPERRFKADSRRLRREQTSPEGKPLRFNAATSRRFLGPALDGLEADHPALVVLAAGLRHLRSAEIPVVVYLNPVDLEHLEALGILDRDGMQRSVDTLRRVIEGSGALFVDAHATFPDSHFRDGLGHFVDRGEIDAPSRLLDRIEPSVRAQLEVAR